MENDRAVIGGVPGRADCSYAVGDLLTVFHAHHVQLHLIDGGLRRHDRAVLEELDVAEVIQVPVGDEDDVDVNSFDNSTFD